MLLYLVFNIASNAAKYTPTPSTTRIADASCSRMVGEECVSCKCAASHLAKACAWGIVLSYQSSPQAWHTMSVHNATHSTKGISVWVGVGRNWRVRLERACFWGFVLPKLSYILIVPPFTAACWLVLMTSNGCSTMAGRVCGEGCVSHTCSSSALLLFGEWGYLKIGLLWSHLQTLWLIGPGREVIAS